jgi:hypothetical protein
MPANEALDNAALTRLKGEIAKDRARLFEQLEKLGLDEPLTERSPGVAATGRLSRVFSLMSA